MKPNIVIFYHALTHLGTPPDLKENALHIICEQMDLLHTTGLLSAANKIVVGLNGGVETGNIANLLIPSKSEVVLHGLQCRNECRTLVLIEEFVKSIPDGEEWYVLYFHVKGASHKPNDSMRGPWRDCMEHHLIKNWKKCVADLDSGIESIGCHWMTGKQTPPGQSIWAGNFWWARSSFLKILPSIYERDRIKVSGIDSLDSRYESEVWIGNGPRLPVIRDYCPGWVPGSNHAAR